MATEAVPGGRFLRCASILLICFFFSTLPRSVAQAQLDILGIFGVHFKREGLDVEGNPIDKLTNDFGFRCQPELRSYDRGKPCRVESELSSLVGSLPHDRQKMADALTALGATCDGRSKKWIDCIYRKRVRLTKWVTGEVGLRSITDDIFLFRITIARGDEASEPHVVLDITQEAIKEEK